MRSAREAPNYATPSSFEAKEPADLKQYLESSWCIVVFCSVATSESAKDKSRELIDEALARQRVKGVNDAIRDTCRDSFLLDSVHVGGALTP
ncbi:hypothetical protein NM688_g5650 [Phlebia brevispora]|uniref:Uncharacterized protein n=1 Tax=Phlebia brevispora TaxID=194682 RepID=A0ACC1SS14_9APHY|nr:hypothetical protein NM688_g5650 [Phlebia brevispora]